MKREDAPEAWGSRAGALREELDRLNLSELTADEIEDYSLTDGYYLVMLRYDDAASLKDKLSKLRSAEGSMKREPWGAFHHLTCTVALVLLWCLFFSGAL